MDALDGPSQIMIKVLSNSDKYDDEYLRKFCYNTGRILRFHLTTGNNNSPKLCFVTFKMKRDAVKAMAELNNTGCISSQFSRKQPVLEGENQTLHFVDSQKDNRQDTNRNFGARSAFAETIKETDSVSVNGSQNSSFGQKNNYDSFRQSNNNNNNNNSTEQFNNKSTEQFNNNSTEQFNNNSTEQFNNNSTEQFNNNSTEQFNNNSTVQEANVKNVVKVSGNCNYCTEKTTNRCSVCYDFYCSVKCQREDWPKHKKDCIAVPPLLKGNQNDCATNQSNVKVNLTNRVKVQRNSTKDEFYVINAPEKVPNYPRKNNNNNYPIRNNNNYRNNNNNYNNNNNDDNNKNEKESFNNNYKKGDDDNYKSPNKTNNNVNVNDIQNGINSMALKSTIKENSQPQQQSHVAIKSPISGSISQLKGIETIIPLSESIVEITHVFTSTIVFCRVIDNPTHDIRYKQNIIDIIKYSETAKGIEKLPARDEIVLAKYDDIYFRGIIAKVVSDTEVKVLFTEYGNVETIGLHDLKEITNDDIKYRPQYVCRADLDGICSADLTAHEKEISVGYLNELVNQPLRMVYNGTLTRNVPVKFYVPSTNECINDTLIELIKKQ